MKNYFRKLTSVFIIITLVAVVTIVSYAATITLSTNSVRLSVSYPGVSASKTVTVRSSETAWTESLTEKPSSSASGVTVRQNRMSSFTVMAAANATPGEYTATVSSGGSKKNVKITVVRL